MWTFMLRTCRTVIKCDVITHVPYLSSLDACTRRMDYTDVESSVAPAARLGFTDGKNYDDFRPTYQEKTVQDVARMLLADRSEDEGYDYDVLELGAGTGKFTRKILGCLPANTKMLVSEPMQDFLATLQSSLPDVKTAQFAARSIPLADNSVQAVVAAQSFHWFADKGSMDEITRVLRPGGNFVVLWNIMDDRDENGIAKKFYEMCLEFRGNDGTQYVDKNWEKALMAYDGFYIADRKLPTFNKEYTEEDFIRFTSTFSFISRMSEEGKSAAYNKIRNLLRNHPDTKNQDKFHIPFYTDIVWCKSLKKS